VLGLSELRAAALKNKQPFAYDTPVAGLRALDRYRFELRLAEPAPRLPYLLSTSILCGAVAREVIEAAQAAGDTNARPVGTGPYRLASWRRASRIVLERNPRYRRVRAGIELPLTPPPADAGLVALASRLQGRTLPLAPRIEIAVITESQPAFLAFLRRDLHALSVPGDYLSLAYAGGQLAPFLQRLGVSARRMPRPSTVHSYFNIEHPTVGGLEPAQVALRRAIALAYDNQRENQLVYGGQFQVAHSMIPPGCYGFDPTLRSALGSGQLQRARALLDTFGFVDSNRDGWRETPAGAPLVLKRAFNSDQLSRRIAELWQARMAELGVRFEAEFGTFGQLISRALAGELMMWGFGWGASAPDGDFFLGLAYGPNAEQSNDARFRLPAFDALYEQQRRLPDGPERLALMQRATRLMQAYVPYIPHQHQSALDLSHAGVSGVLRHPFGGPRWLLAEVVSP
jgi:ABC-type transport system substrate-binding protein